LTGATAQKIEKLAAKQGISMNRAVQSFVDGSSSPSVIRNRKHVVQYSRILISALEEVLEYDGIRQHNQPPPALRVEDPEYLDEIRQLVAELKRLNDILEKRKIDTARAKKQGFRVSKYLDKFFEQLRE
jgi:hypothetical protein